MIGETEWDKEEEGKKREKQIFFFNIIWLYSLYCIILLGCM